MEQRERMMREERSRLSSNKDEFDHWLIDQSCSQAFPQSEYQCRNFVADSHPTKYKAIRQCLMEIQVREHSQRKIDISSRKNKLQIARFERDIEKCEDPIERQILECDRDEALVDQEVWEKKVLQAELEMRYYLDYVKDNCDEEEVKRCLVLDAGEEHKYWIARMAKQSAVDMISSGTINQGNMESILQMSEEDQVGVLAAALKYTGVVNAGIDQIREEAQAEIKYLGKPDDVSKMLGDGRDSNVSG